MRSHRVGFVLAAALLSVGAACGGSPDSSFGGAGAPNDGTSGRDGGGNGPAFNDAGAVNPVNAACATSSASGQLTPANLVFMFDQSGSMGGPNMSVKWSPVTAALSAFFSDAASTGMSASLQYFSQGSTCSSSNYQTPEVPLSPLPSPAFASSISTHSPAGGTPTLPALKGAIDYAKSTAAAKPGEKVAVVLVTDGDPNDCNSTVNNVAAEAATVAATIPTYVIGVGSDFGNLNAMAVGGGTGAAILVTVGDPNKTKADLAAALNKIRGATASCSFAMPKPPSGQVLDINAVNVQFTSSAGPQTLAYNRDCTGGTGWHYDNASAPTAIDLCQATCDSVKAATGGKVSIAFGCATLGGVIK